MQVQAAQCVPAAGVVELSPVHFLLLYSDYFNIVGRQNFPTGDIYSCYRLPAYVWRLHWSVRRGTWSPEEQRTLTLTLQSHTTLEVVASFRVLL